MRGFLPQKTQRSRRKELLPCDLCSTNLEESIGHEQVALSKRLPLASTLCAESPAMLPSAFGVATAQ